MRLKELQMLLVALAVLVLLALPVVPALRAVLDNPVRQVPAPAGATSGTETSLRLP
jgi:type II secretory pathway component PulF